MIPVLLLCFLEMNEPIPIEPASIFIKEQQVPTKVKQISQSTYLLNTQDVKVKVKKGGSKNTWTFTIEPKQEITISFRIRSRVRPIRVNRNEDHRVLQFGIGDATSRLNDAFLIEKKKKILHFSEASVVLHGGTSYGAAIVSFSKFSPQLRVQISELETFTKNADIQALEIRNKEEFSQFTELVKSLRQTNAQKPTLVFRNEQYEESVRIRWSSLATATGMNVTAEEGFSHRDSLDLIKPVSDVWTMDYGSVSSLPEILVTHVVTPTKTRYSVVTIFNYMDYPRTVFFGFNEIGLDPRVGYACFDFWKVQYLGEVAGKLGVTLPPLSSRLLLIRRGSEVPQILGTSAHALGEIGAGLDTSWNSETKTLSGKITLPENRSISVYLSHALREEIFESAEASCDGGEATVSQNRGFFRLQLRTEKGGESHWKVRFTGKKTTPEPSGQEIAVSVISPWMSSIRRKHPEDTNAGYFVFRNDSLVAYFGDSEIYDAELEPDTLYRYAVFPVDFYGGLGTPVEFIVRTPNARDSMIFDTPMERWTGISPPLPEKSRGGGAISVNEKRVYGLSMSIPSEGTFRISRAFEQFEGTVALEDGSDESVEAEFVILGDGKEIWRSKSLKKGLQENFSIPLSQIYHLTLRVEKKSGSGKAYAAWINPVLKAKRP
ncbi:MAG TPA: NPCBM/NEW2 domain-containing protein [Fimbriimonadales bacterium]|nr:NPCBM/NEW2 domain-containing protein [Fimbriimonadales bacterium]